MTKVILSGFASLCTKSHPPSIQLKRSLMRTVPEITTMNSAKRSIYAVASHMKTRVLNTVAFGGGEKKTIKL